MTTRYFLKSASIEGFRGINNDGEPLVLKFRSDTVNSIHAPNGAGKSSIFEAIHFAISGTVPRLEKMQDAERGDNYILNKFHPGQKATVNLTLASDDGTPEVVITVTRDAAGVRAVSSPSGHPNPARFLSSLQEDFVLVDYRRFTDFIDASALERGRSFASLIGLSRYSRLRQALEGAKDTRNINSDLGLSKLEGEVKGGEQALAGVLRRVVDTHTAVTGAEVPAVTSLDPLKTAITDALKGIPLLNPLIGAASVMDMDFDAAEKAIEREEGGEARKALDNLTGTIVVLSGLAVGDADLTDIDRLVGLAMQRDQAVQRVGMAELRSLFQNALTVVTHASWPDSCLCPVCEMRSDQPLQGKLQTKIALYDEAAALDEALSRECHSAPSLAKLGLLEEAAAMVVSPQDRVHIQLGIARRAGSVPTADIERAKAQLIILEQRRVETVERARTESAALQEKLPPSLVQVTKTLSLAKQFRDAARDHDNSFPVLNKKRKALDRLNRWKSFIVMASQAFADAESAMANERIKDIQDKCQVLFGGLVRGGPDVKPTLVRARTSEQIDLKLADFFGLKDLSARALLSESYRNAVAAAIFLAAATKHNGVPRFVVLDDITSSFDAGHQFSLMEAIRTGLRYGAVPDGLQFIILSHDTSLEKYFDRLNGTSDWHHQKLQGMPPMGRLMVSAQGSDRLKTQAETYLNAGQVDIGAPFVRQYLEYKLGHIITKLEIPVPPDYASRGDKRTLSTYIEAITNAIALYHAANRCVLTAQQISDVQNHHAPSIMGNFVSHYETCAGSPFNAYALLGVLQSVDALADCFTYIDPASSQKRFYRRLDRHS